MFSEAYKIATAYTRPLVLSMRYHDGRTEVAVGAYIMLNPDGWVLTAGHVFSPAVNAAQHQEQIDKYDREREMIEGDSSLTAEQKRVRFGELSTDPNWITNYSFWWGKDGVTVGDNKINLALDLALVRLEGLDLQEGSEFPVFKDPSKGMDPGTSLCKLGYSFHNVRSRFDEGKGQFIFEEGSLPLPVFPIEGIYTRNIFMGKTEDGQHEIKFLETSSPGIQGMSGGPTFDRDGTVWAVQSRTSHMALGYHPEVEQPGGAVVEHQFLNVGWGVHPEVISAFLREQRVSFRVSEY